MPSFLLGLRRLASLSPCLLPVPPHLSEASPHTSGCWIRTPFSEGRWVAGGVSLETQGQIPHVPYVFHHTHPHSAHRPGKHPVVCLSLALSLMTSKAAGLREQ